jgi:hypothetical protein
VAGLTYQNPFEQSSVVMSRMREVRWPQCSGHPRSIAIWVRHSKAGLRTRSKLISAFLHMSPGDGITRPSGI